MAKTKKPKIGDRIEHTTIYGVYTGEVTQILSAQFIYLEDENEHVRFCLFTEPWRIAK